MNYGWLWMEIARRSHVYEGQGDGIWLVTIRMDEIMDAVKKARKVPSAKKLAKKRKKKHGD